MLEPINDTRESSSDQVRPYRVHLEVFEGPLDLLLHLIEKQEMDITKVSLVRVTDQYIAYISQLDRISADNLAEFLLIAAKLLLIKSRALLPSLPITEAVEEQDLGEELARQLREYKQFKEAALQLREWEESGLRAYLRLGSLPHLERTLDLTGVSLEDLASAVREALSLQDGAGPVNGVIAPLAVSIADKIRSIETLLARRGSLSFHRLLRKAASREEIIVTFLALLELIKSSRARVEQQQLFGDILVLSAAPVTGIAAPQQPPQQ